MWQIGTNTMWNITSKEAELSHKDETTEGETFDFSDVPKTHP